MFKTNKKVLDLLLSIFHVVTRFITYVASDNAL